MGNRSTANRFALILLVLTASVLPAAARTKAGQVKTALTNPANAAGSFTNTSSKGNFAYRGTKFTLKAKATTVADTDGTHCSSDDIICLVNMVVVPSGDGSIAITVALRGEAKKGTITASHDLCKDRDSTVTPEMTLFCPETFGVLTPISVSAVAATCYAADPAWSAANLPTFAMVKTGHACEGVMSGVAPPPATAVLFTSGSTLIVE